LIAQQVDSSEEGAVNKPTSAAACSSNGSFNNISMTGSEIFKFAVRAVPQIVGSALKHAGLTVEHIDWLVLHQVRATPSPPPCILSHRAV
jgi:3-oxoacyl-[acyl-carrier-protein] synthase-3